MKGETNKSSGSGRLRWLALLMTIAILAITGFQGYWLTENYRREQKSLQLKTDAKFRETITKLQISKLRIGEFTTRKDGEPTVKVFVSDSDDSLSVKRLPGKEQVVTTMNIIREKLRDSLKPTKKVVLTMDNNLRFESDSIQIHRTLPDPPPGKEHIFDLLYGVDSLQDSIRVEEVRSEYARQLSSQRIRVPFTIKRTDSVRKRTENNAITVGFTRPVTFSYTLGNTFPYLLKQITQPIIFSLLLLGLTIVSFVLLYKNLLRQQRLAELKNEFISNITHELKTPIATVGVAIEALKNFNAIQDPARTREYLDISSNELHRLGLLVDKVLKLSMFEKKELELKYELLDLDELVNEVMTSLKLQLEKYHATVTLSRQGDLHLQGDRLHLLSVIFNLVDNALKYSRENPAISIEMKGNENEIELKVQDNGIGIPPAYKEKIFEKFFRIPHGDTHNAKGYGLGLSYVSQVVKKHGGSVSVDSAEGITVFKVTLPKTSNQHGKN